MRMYLFVPILVFILISCFSCSKDDSLNYHRQVENSDFFHLRADNGDVYEAFLLGDSSFHVKVPHDIDLSKLTPVFSLDADRVQIGEEQLNSGQKYFNFSDFVKPVKIKCTYSDTLVKDIQINLYDIPILLIDTPDGKPIESKQERIEGCSLQLIDKKGEMINLGNAGVKGRGNSTWKQPKKPYNIKLDEKKSILGMNKSKKWVLLSHPYYDRTQLHNSTSSEMARLTDYKWVPSGEYVELIFNGVHQGLYYLCEKIEVAKNKINIEEMSISDSIGEALTGGYLLETAFGNIDDNRFQTNYFNTTVDASNPLFWEINSPDNFSKPQYDYIQDYMNKFESVLMDTLHISDGRYREYIDIETAINWMLVNETALNSEAKNPSNLFLYKRRGGQIFFGPPWDFDAWTFGLRQKDATFVMKRPSFYFYYFLKDPYFVNRLKEKWGEYKEKWGEEIPEFINRTAEYIEKSALRNEAMWPDWHPLNYYPIKSYKALVQEMTDSFLRQVSYMDSVINALPTNHN